MKKNFLLFIVFIYSVGLNAQIEVPKVYSNISTEGNSVYLNFNGKKVQAAAEAGYSLANFKGNPKATVDGLEFDFDMPDFNGVLIYGFIHQKDGKYPLPVYFKRPSKIVNGKSSIDIRNVLSGKYDMVNWKKNGKAVLGYRIMGEHGELLYEGKIGFRYENDNFSIDNTIEEGPFVNLLNESGATISFTTNNALIASVEVNGKKFSDEKAVKVHEIKLEGLNANTEYSYQVNFGENTVKYSFKTAPKPGTKSSFMFAYASDSRGNKGGGERNFYGSNAYMVKKITALAKYKNAAFMQFTGDLVSGYVNSTSDIDLQYANWKRTIEPFAHYFPVVATMGNHEVINYVFPLEKGSITIDKFPFETESAEAVFARNFVNPLNGPESEDHSKYDPSTNTIDFPSYKENSYYYTYDNVAIVVMNSDYFYAPSLKYALGQQDGNLHGYIMDNQFDWLKSTIGMLEKDENIDHIFVSMHTPAFPNGGHSGDDMWYGGKNKYRPSIAGKLVDKGIIERRDEILDVVVNQSKKTVAFLTGDEHNFNVFTLDQTANIYPENWTGKKLKLNRTFYQINNGAAGAPYYAQEKLPWSNHVEGFTTQNALVLVYIEASKVKIKVINPDTFDIILEKELR